MQFPTGGYTPRTFGLNQCDSGGDSKVWMEEVLFSCFPGVYHFFTQEDIMEKTTTHHMVKIAFLSTLAVILFIFEFPIIPGSPLQVDLSDLPVILGGVLFGPGAVLMIAFLKNLLHVFFISRNAGIVGEIANFAYALFIAMPLAIAFKNTKLNQSKTIVVSILTVFIAAGLMHVFNYYVTFPLYGLSKEGAWGILSAVYLPFNIIKGSLLMVLFIVLKPFFDRMQA